MRTQTLWEMTRDTVVEFDRDDCMTMASSLSYYTVFSLPPLLLIVVRGAGALFGSDRVEREVVSQALNLVGVDGATQVQVMLQAAAENEVGHGFALIASIIGLLFAATGAFVQLQNALNKVWGFEPNPNASIITYFFVKRLLSMGMVITVGFLLLVSLALSALIAAAGRVFEDYMAGAISGEVIQAMDLAANVIIFWMLFAIILRWLPDGRIAWRDVWVGALSTTILFMAAKYGVAFYLGKSNVAGNFGAAGALAILMLWVYFASMVLLLGAEFTQVWARRRGRQIAPEPGAVRA
jgi:membrane protein